MPIREKNSTKCKEWEQRRRERLNDAFNNLAQLLPHHDPAKLPAKIEILEKSTEFVKELRLSNSRLLSSQAENDEKCKLIKELQDEVNKLILRVKQLTILLKKAKITIPTGPEIKSLGSKKQKWSGRLKPEDSENAGIHSNESTTNAAGALPSTKDSSANDGAVSSISNMGVVNTSGTMPVTISRVSSNSVGTNPIPASSTSHGPPIIIPLKEANSIKVAATTTTPVTTTTTVVTASVSTPGLSLKSPLKGATLLSVSSASSPIKLISAEPIFTTTTATQLQLPLQTYILAPCPTSGVTTAYPTAQQSQFVQRVVLPTPILPKPVDGVSFQKIPIKSVLKPIAKVIRRRRKRSKKVKGPANAAATKDVNVKTEERAQDAEKSSNDKGNDGEMEICDITSLSNDKTTTEEGMAMEGIETETASLSSQGKDGNSQSADSVSPGAGDIANDPTVNVSTNDKHEPVVISPAMEEKAPVEQITVEPSSDGESLKGKSRTATLEEISAGSTTDDIPVLRIIEKDVNPEDSGIGRDGILCSVATLAQNMEPISENTAVVRDETIEENTVTKQQLVDKDMGMDKTSTAPSKSITDDDRVESVTINVKQNERKGDLEQEKVENTNPVMTSQANTPKENINKNSVSKAMPTTRIEGRTETIPQSEQLQPPGTSKNQDSGKPISAKLHVAEKKSTEMDRETRPAESQIARPSTNELKATDIGNMSVSRVFKQLESEVRIPSTTDIRMPSQPQRERESLIPEHVSMLPAIMPQPVIAACVPPKPKDIPVPSTSGNNTKTLHSLHHHQELMDTSDAVTTTDKISECIARSIDLIDANDSELMELGDHWEDTGGSPKSPISPTQMFLNMFPLLPKESTGNDHQHSQPSTSQQQQHHSIGTSSTPSHKTSIAPFAPSSSSRSSFFIDAMLPEDHSANSASIVEEMGIVPSSGVAPCLAMTPPQFSSSSAQQISSPFSLSSLSSNYYWTPAATSCSVDNPFEYRPTPSIIPSQRGNNNSTSSGGASTSNTFTLASSGAPKSFSTFSNVSTASIPTFSTISSIATTTATVTSSTITSKNSVQTVKTGKSAKSTPVSKSHSISDLNFHPIPSAKTTKPATSTVATTSVTWTLSAPAQSAPSYAHHHSSSITTAQPQMSQNAGANTQVHFSHHGNANIVPTSACSLLDSLNPMDASFFRPLMNALDAHDFRTLDFGSGNPLPPPPPPLPPLIPQVSTKSLFTPQVNSTTSQPTGINVNYHQPTITPHEPHIPTLQTQTSLFHHLPSTGIFGSSAQHHQQSSTTGSGTAHSSTGSPKKQQNANLHSLATSAHQQPIVQPPPPLPVTTKRGNTSATEKPSKTSGRQKAESSRQSKSGKSSRTQPYYIPNASSSQVSASQTARQDEQNLSRVSVSHLPTTPQTNTDFLIGQNNQLPSISFSSSQIQKLNASHLKSYDMQPQQSSADASSFHAPHPNYGTPTSSANNARLQPSVQQTTPVQKPTYRSSSLETKSQKSKEEKSKATATTKAQSNNSKSSHQSQHPPNPPTSSAPAAIQRTNHSAASLSQQPLRNAQTSTAQPLPKPVTQISSKTMQTPAQIDDNNANMSHPFQFHTEPFLFPDFSGGSGSRQFGTHNQYHHSHYNPETVNEGHSQQQEQASSSSYSQRSHPYYMSGEIPPFESFTMPIQQHQPVQVAHHPTHSQTVAASHTRPSHSSSGFNQSQSNTKYNYAPNIQVANSQNSQLPIPTSESTGHQHNLPQQLSQTSAAVPQAPSAQSHHHPSMVRQENPAYTQQQQHRGHLPQTPSVSQPPQNQANNTQRQSQEPSRGQQPQQPTQQRTQLSTSIAPASLSSSIVSATSKSKQSQQPTLAPPFTQTPQPTQTNQPHHLHQQVRHQSQHQPQQIPTPTQQQQPNRSNSRTVNWMTDTGYRTSSSSSNIGNAKHRQGQGDGGPTTSNPFSVSKLVGSTSSGQVKNQTTSNIEQHQSQPPIQRPSNVPRGKAPAATNNSNNSGTAGPSSTNLNSQNQSNYCAEALIRKNPPTGNEWNDFGFGTNPTFQGYSTHHPYHNPSHAGNQNPPPTADNSNYGHYHYPPSTSTAHSSAPAHFPNFDYSQPQQQFPVSHNNPNNNQHQQGSYHSSSTQQQHHQQIQHTHQHAHTSQPPHSSHHQSNQLQYPNQPHHHPHHQSHGSTSTSSVSNFNLSTIFPEINDKRSGTGGGANANNVGHGNTGNSGISSARSAGGQSSSSCGYHQHPGFGHQPGSGRNPHQ